MDAWIFEILKTMKLLKHSKEWRVANLKYYRPTKLGPKPYTKSTLTNKSLAKRKKKQINTYLNSNKDVVDSKMEPHSTNNPLMAMEKSFFPFFSCWKSPKSPWTASSANPNAKWTQKIESRPLYHFFVFFINKPTLSIPSTRDIYQIYCELLNVSRYFHISKNIANFSRRSIADPFDLRYITIWLIYQWYM